MPKLIAAESLPWERIHHWILDRDNNKLSKQDREIFERWDYADNLLRKFPRKKQIANLLKQKFSISTSTAYADIFYAQKLFGSVYTLDREWHRNYLLEDGLLLIEIAKSKGDLKSWAAERRNLIILLGLDQKEDQKVDPEVLEAHNFFTVIQIGSVTMKLDVNQFLSMPVTTRNKLMKELNRPISEEEAEALMNS